MKEKIIKNATKISLYLIFLLPLLDIYRALVGNKIEFCGISFVEILHFTFVSILLLLLFFQEKENKKVNKRKLLLLPVIYIIYIILHLIYIYTTKDISFISYSISKKSLFIETYFIIKSYILPLIIMYVYIKNKIKVLDIIDILSKVSFIFSIIIVITNLLNVSLIAYNGYEGNLSIKGSIISWFYGIKSQDVDLYTSKGLFYSTNQISAVLGSLLFISSFYTLYKDDYKNYLSFFIKALAALMISTKTALFAIFLSVIAIYVYALMKLIINKEKVLTKKSLAFIFIIMFISFLYNYSPVKIKMNSYIQNNKNNLANDWGENLEVENLCTGKTLIELEENYNVKLSDINTSNMTDNEKEFFLNYFQKCPGTFNIPTEYVNFYPPLSNSEFWLDLINEKTSIITNHRKVKNLIYNDFLKKHANINDQLFGIGYVSRFPYMEKDIIGQKVWFGILGVALFILPYIVILAISLIRVIIGLKKKLTIQNISLLLASTYMIFASLFAGHIFGNFIPNTILAILISALYHSTKYNSIKDDKVSFMLLHLGYGGIESAVINTANSLCEKYDIELVSFYKLNKNQANKIDNKIKIKYLYNGEPNKEQFLGNLKKKNILGILKEGIKSASILIKKKALIVKYIILCDAKYIVSTRWQFNILLSKYGNSNSIKIAEEHHYHNNDKKYLNVIKNKYYNIDYLFALTKTLEQDYKKVLKNNHHTKVILMPNMLYEIPSKTSKLDTKNIITVSRLDYGKKNDDIIKSFAKLEDKELKLYIIGDGKEYENLKNLVNNLELKDRVILTGYKNKDEIEKYMLKSSLFLMASLTEGLPMVLLEAMSYGIPCIAYETASGVNDIIRDGKNGFVIKNRNEKEYIKNINKIMNDNDLRKEMGKEARKTICNFSKDEILKKWYKVLDGDYNEKEKKDKE